MDMTRFRARERNTSRGSGYIKKGSHPLLLNKQTVSGGASLLCLGVIRLFFGGSQVVSSRRLVEHGSVKTSLCCCCCFSKPLSPYQVEKKTAFLSEMCQN